MFVCVCLFVGFPQLVFENQNILFINLFSSISSKKSRIAGALKLILKINQSFRKKFFLHFLAKSEHKKRNFIFVTLFKSLHDVSLCFFSSVLSIELQNCVFFAQHLSEILRLFSATSYSYGWLVGFSP